LDSLVPRWGGASITLAVTALGAGASRARALVANLRRIAERAEVIEGDAVVDDPGLAAALRVAEASEADMRVKLDEIVGLVSNLDRQLLELAPSQRFYRFLAERAASSEYRSQLGVVSLVRRDFEELVQLMHTWRSARTVDGEEAATRPIDRIVLYIDDLDRCEPDQVVAVLQAVHLLLAMDLFVVVVGVDPRWLLRSLSTRYEALLRLPQEGPADAPGALRRATPHDYLEKIFQVPFVLPAMDKDDLGGLLRHLTTGSPAAVDSPAESSKGSSVTGKPAGPVDPGPVLPAPAPGPAGPTPLPAETHSEVAELSLGRTQAILTPITDPELALLGRLSGLVRTPRAATRLVNIYGLLRSTRSLHEGGDFLGSAGHPGSYQAVGQLLGVLIGAPHLMGSLLWGISGASSGLCSTAAPASWYQFVNDLEPKRAKDAWSNRVANPLSAEDAQAWQSLVRQLNDVLPFVDLDDIRPYQTWGPRIARFSFILSPFAGDDLASRGASPL
jgi:hypothetical protein